MRNLRAEVLAADALRFVDISKSRIQDGGSKDGRSEAAMPFSIAPYSFARMWLKISVPSRSTPPFPSKGRLSG